MTRIAFACCFCGTEVAPDDEESAQVVLVWPWREGVEGEEQMWFAHRKPCFEAALIPEARHFGEF